MEKIDVRQLVEQTGLMKQDVAAALGTSTASLRRWERGDAAIPDDKRTELMRLAQGGEHVVSSKRDVPAVQLAHFPSQVLIEELARRARGGLLRDFGEGR